MATALVALGLAASIGGWTGFNVGLAVGGTALGLWGAFLSVQATRDGREVREVVLRSHAADQAIRLTTVLYAMGDVERQVQAFIGKSRTANPVRESAVASLVDAFYLALREADFGNTLSASWDLYYHLPQEWRDYEALDLGVLRRLMDEATGELNDHMRVARRTLKTARR